MWRASTIWLNPRYDQGGNVTSSFVSLVDGAFGPCGTISNMDEFVSRRRYQMVTPLRLNLSLALMMRINAISDIPTTDFREGDIGVWMPSCEHSSNARTKYSCFSFLRTWASLAAGTEQKCLKSYLCHSATVNPDVRMRLRSSTELESR
jgi:hypothetical protein